MYINMKKDLNVLDQSPKNCVKPTSSILMIFLYLIQTIKGHDNKSKIGGLFNNNFVKC